MWYNITTMADTVKLTLASGSPRRAKILADLGLSFDVVRTDAQEVSLPDDPERTVRENALAKGAALGGRIRHVLSADTIVWLDGKIFGKPRDLDEARAFLRELSGRTHTVFTGVAYDGDARVVKSTVTFRRLSDATIEKYLARVNPLDRAGAYDIDACGDMLVKSRTGSYENIMGLPVGPLVDWGIVNLDARRRDAPAAKDTWAERTSRAAATLVALLNAKDLKCATAESCTGGGVGFAITSVPGSSAVYLGGVVSYDNEVKHRVLGVQDKTLETFGAVSAETALEMAEGAWHVCCADIAVSITGIAGPGGGTDEKPVGLVWFGLATLDGGRTEKAIFAGDRDAVRAQAVLHAIGMLTVAAAQLPQTCRVST